MADELDIAIANATALMPGVPAVLIRVYAEELVATGDPELALAAMRQAPEYDTYFAGNRREDGSVRYTENEYLAITESFSLSLASYGVDPSFFAGMYGELIAGEVSPAEFERRISQMYQDIVSASEEVRAYYADQYGIDASQLSDEELFAAALDPSISEDILNQRISVATIGGAGSVYGFDVDPDIARRLADRDMTASDAAQLFSSAALQLPVLDVLARRHNDQDDSFDLNEFIGAMAEMDPTQTRRIQRLFAQEASLFSSGGTFRRTDYGVTGLQAS